jgi:protein-S-isoprenylcysteine O-methyltransferase Ste14
VSRAVVTAVFVALTVAVGSGTVTAWEAALADPTIRSWAIAGYATLKLAVAAAFTYFVLVREPARQPSRDPVAFAACVVALTAFVAFRKPSESESTFLVVAGDLVALAFGVWLLVAVFALGRCFGVLPEARGLVTRGPYRFVRHPVYLGEIGACAGLVLAALSVWNVVALSLVVAAQVVRMRLEERALAAEFPEYTSYAARTPRLIPRVASTRFWRPRGRASADPGTRTDLASDSRGAAAPRRHRLTEGSA